MIATGPRPARFDYRDAAGARRMRERAVTTDRPASVRIQGSCVLPPPPDGGAAVAVTLTDCVAEPPGPVHAKVNVSVAATDTASVPLVASLPVQPEPPLAVHVVAFALLQVSVTVPPAVTDDALEVSVTVGAAEATFRE